MWLDWCRRALQMFIQMNGEGIIDTSEGKPGARAPNFRMEEEKKV